MELDRLEEWAAREPGNVKLWNLLLEHCRVYGAQDTARHVVREHAYAMLHCTEQRAAWYDLYRRAVLFCAPMDFDSYMIACEWNREPRARFWLPRRRVLEGQHHIASQIQAFIDDPAALYLGFSMPPGCGKSTLIKFLLAYIAGRWPMSANMYVSYADGMVKMMYESVRSILSESEYGHGGIFPSASGPLCSAEYNTISYRRRGDFPTVGLVSLSGSVTGRTRANKFLITDDLVKNAEVARNPERLEKLYADYRATLTTRMIGENVKQIMLGTIWSVHDPISRMMADHEGDARYKFIAIPVWNEDEESNFLFDHEDRYTPASIRALRDTLPAEDFSALYMQAPMEREGLAFPEDSLRYYGGVLPDGEPDNIFFFCDVAWGGGDSLSLPIAYQFGGDVYIHDVVFDKGDKFVTKPRVVGKILQHRVRMGRFEANNGGDEYCGDIARILREEHGYSCNLGYKKAPGNMSKLARIEQHSPVIRTFYFRDAGSRSAEYRRFMQELVRFSFTAKNLHDDAPDSLAGLVDYYMHGHSIATVFRKPF